ncbi:replication protein C [Rhodobacteraceae bacterium PD-2]|nr:replication protein C [Rhodobacteraceae bacterium PD-2]
MAVKRVGAAIGLKAGDMMLLDTLGAFTQAQDWEEGQRPIVWASNAYLMAQTGFSLSALKRHARRLAEAGVISFRDSPNGKRWGRRDARGRIAEAYGFDLSPLSARVAEFEALHPALQAERALCQRLKRQITVARRMIRARIEAAVSDALRGPWIRLTHLFEELLGRLPRQHQTPEQLAQLLSSFTDLQDRVEAAYLKATHVTKPVENTSKTGEQLSVETQQVNAREFTCEPHIQITNQLDQVTRNASKNAQVITVLPNPGTPCQAEQTQSDQISERRRARAPMNLSTVMHACPEFASWARNIGGFLKDWGDLHRIAGQLRPMIGVSEQAWNLAQVQLGRQQATAALALVFEKHCAGEVASPSGYLRGIVTKAGAGELHLERSFYGRISAQAA